MAQNGFGGTQWHAPMAYNPMPAWYQHAQNLDQSTLGGYAHTPAGARQYFGDLEGIAPDNMQGYQRAEGIMYNEHHPNQSMQYGADPQLQEWASRWSSAPRNFGGSVDPAQRAQANADRFMQFANTHHNLFKDLQQLDNMDTANTAAVNGVKQVMNPWGDYPASRYQRQNFLDQPSENY